MTERKDFKLVTASHYETFIQNLQKKGGYSTSKHEGVTGKSHLDRMWLSDGINKVVVVYDTKAQMLSLTADGLTHKKIDTYVENSYPHKKDKIVDNSPANVDNFAGNGFIIGKPSNNGGIVTRAEQLALIEQLQAGDKKAKKPTEKKPTEKKKVTPKTKTANKGKGGTCPKDGQEPKVEKKVATKTKGAKLPKNDNSVVVEEKEKVKEDKNNFNLKNYSQAQLDNAFVLIKADKIKIKRERVDNPKEPTETRTFIISQGSNKLKLRFMPSKLVLQLQGQDNSFMDAVKKALLTSEKTIPSAKDKKNNTRAKKPVKAQTPKPTPQEKAIAKQVDNRLKKVLPNAMKYLTEVSKSQFDNGIMEVNSDSVHADYSIILLPTCRGLERLIYDLQQAKNIEVKLIGQAYEKVPNGYELKDSYKKKINSIVYAEVMSALYNEYFKTRNFYMHSDNSLDNNTRVIATKDEARKIVDEIIDVVEYNCKKLREINF